MLTFITRLFSCHRTNAQYPSAVGLLLVRNQHKLSIPVAWEKPKVGWTKLNFDGSSKGKCGKASIGGVFRDHNAKFLLGYAESIESSDNTTAELAALLKGLELIVENGWTNLWLEGDAEALVNMIVQRRTIKSSKAQRYVSRINTIIPKINNCTMTHIYREGNRAADKFAEIGHNLEKPRVWRHAPPDEVLPIMQDDAKGKIVLRFDLTCL